MNMPELSDVKGSSVRTILQGLILAGIIGIVTMLWHQNEATATQNVSIGQLQIQIANLQVSLKDLPDLDNRVTRLEVNQLELDRRINNADNQLGKMDNKSMRGWSR